MRKKKPFKHKEVFKKLKEGFRRLCKYFDDACHRKVDSPLNTFSIYFVIAVAIFFPMILGEDYIHKLPFLIVIEFIYFVLIVFFISCVLFFYKKSLWHWCTFLILLAHYISFINIGSDWNKQYNIIYVGTVFIYFISFISWKSAKGVNKRGGIIDTVLLAIGVACCVIGFITLPGGYKYAKQIISVGVALIYLYALARTLYWLFYTQEEIKLNLIKTICYITIYIILLVGLPFFLAWVGVNEEIIKNIIIPIYASMIGGALALAGVAWTIRHTIKERELSEKKRDEERKEEERKRFVPYVKLCLNEKKESYVDARFYRGIDLKKDCAKLKDKTFYVICIKNFTIKNISATNIILCGVTIDKTYYPFDNKLILESGESCAVSTTKNFNVNLAEKISEIFLVVQDILQNFYYLNCLFTSNINAAIPYLIMNIHDEEYIGYRMDYQIKSIELPTLLIKEPTNE